MNKLREIFSIDVIVSFAIGWVLGYVMGTMLKGWVVGIITGLVLGISSACVLLYNKQQKKKK